MALKTEPLAADYAVVAGARIVENAAGLKMPDKVKKRYLAWLAANERLTQQRRDKRTDIRSLDGALDRAVGVPAAITQAILDGYTSTLATLDDAQRQRLDDARDVHAVFGDDLRTITSLPYAQEWARVRDVLHALQDGPLAPAVKRLGLLPDVRLVASLHESYGAQLGITGKLASTDEAQAIADWNASLHQLLVAVTFFDDEHPELRAALEPPYEQQLAAQRKAASADRKRTARAGKETEPTRPGDDG